MTEISPRPGAISSGTNSLGRRVRIARERASIVSRGAAPARRHDREGDGQHEAENADDEQNRPRDLNVQDPEELARVDGVLEDGADRDQEDRRSDAYGCNWAQLTLPCAGCEGI